MSSFKLATAPSFCSNTHSSLSRSSTMERRQSLLGSLRKKFSRKASNSPAMGTSSRGNSFGPGHNTVFDHIQPKPAPKEQDCPPAYTAIAPTPSTPTTPTTTSTPTTNDDPYAFLAAFDTVFLIDDSGSMAGARWAETRAALETIAPICTARDADGIDIHFLNAPDHARNKHVTSAAAVSRIFDAVRPCGCTPTGQRLNALLKPYLSRYAAAPDATKPLNIIVVTDGQPSDDVESVLIGAARRLDKMDAPAWQVGVQFFQVGRDPEARAHLRQLDDELAELAGDQDLRDMVDAVPFKGAEGECLTADGILKVVLGAVNRRLDRKRSAELHRRAGS